MALLAEHYTKGYAVGGFGRCRLMIRAIRTSLNDMHDFTSAPRVAPDVKRIGTNQDTSYGVNTRIKKYFSHVVFGC